VFGLSVALSACGGAPAEIVTVQETVVVEVPATVIVQVTRAVEVEVTRLVKVTEEVIVTATPTPTPPPTSTPDAPQLGSRDNPYPLGTAAGLEFDDGSQTIPFALTVKEVLRGEPALARIMAANQFNDPPPDGFEFVLLLVEAAYTGPDDGVLELSKSMASSVTNRRIIAYSDTFTYSPCCVEPEFDMQLLSGGTGEGWIALPVAVDDPNPLLLVGKAERGVYLSLTE
jgi:hypothetical protein